MSRLTKWVNGEVWYYTKDDHFPAREMDGYESLLAMNKLAHYEDLEEQGRLIELPCKLGDTIWIVRENIHEATICRIVLNISESNNFINLDVAYEYVDWFYNDGRKAKATALCRYLSDAFLTKEEAEAKLAELKGGKADGN